MNVRVLTIRGPTPIILTVPHGSDDFNTHLIAEVCAQQLKCCAIINYGFERADHVDVDHDKADCNRYDHVTQPIICDEYLIPLLDMKDRLKQKLLGRMPSTLPNSPAEWPKVLVVHIHGAGNLVHKQADEPVGLIVGWGAGINQDSPSCTLWRKDCFMFHAMGLFEKAVVEGKGGGKFAGRGGDNMNQCFVRRDVDRFVDSLQLEFPYSSREDDYTAKIEGLRLSQTLKLVLQYKSPRDFKETLPKIKAI